MFQRFVNLLQCLWARLSWTGGAHYLNGGPGLPPPLTPEEEKALLARMADGDPAARDELITHNLRLVVYLAKKYEGSGVPSEDMVSIGTIGLIKAVNTFTPERSIKLATYASRCIGNEILMYLRKSSNRRQEASIDEPLNIDGDGNELLLSDILGSDENMVGQQLEQDAERAGLRRAVNSLSARERRRVARSAACSNCRPTRFSSLPSTSESSSSLPSQSVLSGSSMLTSVFCALHLRRYMRISFSMQREA